MAKTNWVTGEVVAAVDMNTLGTDVNNRQPLDADLTALAALTAPATKLSGVAAGATANDTDANLKARANHTGTQTASTISDLIETVQDLVGAEIVAGTNVTVSYNDTAGTVTINASGATGSVSITGTPSVGQVPIATSTTTATWQNQAAFSAALGINVKDYGAVGNGGNNDTTAIQNAYNAANSAGKPLYFPVGVYVVTALPDFADDSVIRGDGSRKSIIWFNGTGALRQLSNKYGILFQDIGFQTTTTGSSVLMQLSNCFRVSFLHCRFKGNHNDGTGTTYRNQIGVKLDANTGACNFINCDWENLGVGLQTWCIQNDIQGGKFTVCWRGIHGTGSNFGNGIHCVQTEFIGGSGGTSSAHVWVDGGANAFNFEQCWFEKSDWGMDIGVAGSGGPSQLGITNCEFGVGPGGGVRINHCRQPFIMNCKFEQDQGYSAGTSKEVTINGTNAGGGVVINPITTVRADFVTGDFPNWNTTLM